MYVGETDRTIRERLKEQRADVFNRGDKPIADDFNSDGHSAINVVLVVHEKMKGDSRLYRQSKEQKEIKNLTLKLPK